MPKKGKSKRYKNRAPFGVVTKRFQCMGLHPNLDKSGSMKKNKSPLGPGEYDAKPHECAYKKAGCSSWKRKVYMEEFSNNLGFRNANILRERAFRKSIGGPGFYDLPEKAFKQQTSSAMYNVGFGRQKRFWDPVQRNTPAPGTYDKDVVYRPLTSHKHFSNLPTFDWDGFIDRFKNQAPPYAKPPNLYNPRDAGTIDALLTKVVSKRGPYDLFTGPRDDSTIKNHFAMPAAKGPLNWFNTWPTHLEILLNHPLKQRNGQFFKEVRFGRATQKHMLSDLTLCDRDPDDPSPCHYKIEKSPREFKQNTYAFNASVKEARSPTQWKIHPGVGRYSSKFPECAKLKQESWVFKSVVGRTEYKAVEYNSF